MELYVDAKTGTWGEAKDLVMCEIDPDTQPTVWKYFAEGTDEYRLGLARTLPKNRNKKDA